MGRDFFNNIKAVAQIADEEGGDGAPSWHVVCTKCCDTGRAVIPLAEALKESNEERT